MPKCLYLLSDSIGETVLRVARAATTQFENWGLIEYHYHFNLKTKSEVDHIIEEARQSQSCFIYTVVEKELNVYLSQELERVGLPSFNVMDPVLQLIAELLGSEPMLRPGLTHKLDATYYERIEAIEFAVRYDDGKYPKGFLEADLVLLGVSRTSKTPLSMYLANKGYKVANLPLLAGSDIPVELEQMPREKIVGLTVSADKLLQVRQERLKDLRLPPESAYAQKDHIDLELHAAQELFARLGCKVIDVTYKAIEETASQVIELITKNKQNN